jgi:hypothetical protein
VAKRALALLDLARGKEITIGNGPEAAVYDLWLGNPGSLIE